MMQAWILWAAITAAAPAPASESNATTAPAGLRALAHVRLWTGDGREATDATVAWRDGVITYVGQAPPPPGAIVQDGSGKVLTPGFIETRSFIGTEEIDQEASTRDMDTGQAWAAPAFAPADGFNPASEHIPLCRQEGITHAITGPSGHVLAGLAHWVRLGLPASVARDAPAALWGSVDKSAAEHAGGTRGHLWMRLRGVLEDVRFFDMHAPAWERNQTRPLALDPMHLRAIGQSLRDGTPWVLTANRASDIAAAVAFAQGEHIRLVISGGAEAWQVAPLLAQADVPVILTPSQQQPSSFDCLGARPDGATLLHAAGVKVILSTGLSVMAMPWLRQQAGMAVAHGLAPQAALAAVTQTPALVFNRNEGLGTIGKGKPATMVLWSSDPFELWSVAENVWIAGESVNQTTRQQRLFKRYHRPPA